MEVLPLRFTSPKELNALKEAQASEPVIWQLFETEDVLELNTENWHIATADLSVQIDAWEVNEQTHQMRPKSQETVEGFVPLDYPFAVSMIGQIGNKQLLQSYLVSLQNLYLASTLRDAEKPTTPNDIETTKKEDPHE